MHIIMCVQYCVFVPTKTNFLFNKYLIICTHTQTYTHILNFIHTIFKYLQYNFNTIIDYIVLVLMHSESQMLEQWLCATNRNISIKVALHFSQVDLQLKYNNGLAKKKIYFFLNILFDRLCSLVYSTAEIINNGFGSAIYSTKDDE